MASNGNVLVDSDSVLSEVDSVILVVEVVGLVISGGQGRDLLVVLLLGGLVISVDKIDDELSELEGNSADVIVELSEETSVADDGVDESCVDVSKLVAVVLCWSVE